MNSVSYLIAGLMILDQNLSYQFDMSENSTKKVQTSPLFLNQIENFVTVNSEKTLNSHQITKNIHQIGKSCGKVAKRCRKLQKGAEVAKRCGKLRKVAESCEKLRNCEISKSCDFRNFRNRAKFQRVCAIDNGFPIPSRFIWLALRLSPSALN